MSVFMLDFGGFFCSYYRDNNTMESLNIPVVVLCMMIIAYFGMKWMNKLH